MRFAHPQLLWLLLVLVPLGLCVAYRLRAGRRALDDALSARMAQRLTAHLAPGRRTWRLALLLMALVALVLGAARPQRGAQYVTAKRTGRDLVIALDVSESMLAEDLKPNRLARARQEIAAILDHLRGDRIGLVAFAGAAFVQCPLTLDYSAARMFLDFMGPELISEPGTALAEAVRVGVRAFDAQSEGFRAMILISDGEDHQGNLEAAAREARKAGVRVFAIGIGSEAGEPIPQRDAAGKIQGYKRDSEGHVILTRLDAQALRTIAEASGGLYVSAGSSLGLERVLGEIETMERREMEGGLRLLYEERYHYFVWPALVLLLLELLIPLRRGAWRQLWRPAVRRWRVPGLTIGVLVLAVVCGPARGAPAPPPGAPPAGQPARAEADPVWLRQLEENEVFRARHPGDPRPLYNLGNLYHEQGGFARAAELYQGAQVRAAGPLRGAVDYNLGNTRFRAGDLQSARDAFLAALRGDPGNENAKLNLELTQRMLDAQQAQSDSLGQKSQEGQQNRSSTGQGAPEKDSRKSAGERQKSGESSDSSSAGQQQKQQQQEGKQPEAGESSNSQGESQSPQGAPESGAQDQQQDGQMPAGETGEQGADRSATPSYGESRADSSAANQPWAQILRGLEGAERDLLKRRFQARARNLRVEKDW